MKQRGFTVVEIIVTLAIITIISVMAIVILQGGQAAARDDERTSKAQTIADGLESYFSHGYTHPTNPALSVGPGQYPSTAELSNAQSDGYFDSWLTGVESSTLRYTWQEAGSHNLAPYEHPSNQALNGDISDITAKATTTDDLYQVILYEPLRPRTTPYGPDADQWEICTTTDADNPCTRFNLYYALESDDSLATMRSKN